MMDGPRLFRPSSPLVPPYGGKLVELQVSPERAVELKAASRYFPSLDLTARELGDLELLATGAFSPLTTFMGRADYESVCADMRLRDGMLWPLPIVLEAPAKVVEGLGIGARIALRDAEGTMVAILTIEELFERDRRLEAERLFSAPKGLHPDAAYLYKREGHVCLTGRLEVVALPEHHDFTAFRQPPATVRAALAHEGNKNAVGYMPHGLLHRAHVEFSREAALTRSAPLLVFASVGLRYLEEPAFHRRVRALRAALESYPQDTARLNVMSLSPRQAGARAALLTAIVARNFGCSHLIVEHDSADLGEGAHGKPCYGNYQTIATLERHARDLRLEIIPFRDLIPEEDCPETLLHGPRRAGAGTDAGRLREMAQWFSYPRVLHEMRKPFRGGAEHGLTIFFTGLSGAGKSTIARILQARLMECGERHVTMLDGDLVRKHLSSELGFSREHRNLNVLRLGYVASLVTQHHGIAICAPIAPYSATRAQVRAMIEPHGAFVEVYIATSLDVCEGRDRKGLYARARQGLIPQFTGISDPYEPPTHAEIVIDTAKVSAVDAVQHIFGYLTEAGYLVPPETAPAEEKGPVEFGRAERDAPGVRPGEMPATR